VSIPVGQRIAASFGVVCIPLTIVIGTLWVEHVNDANYGLAITNVEQTSMSAGLGPMFRVDPATTFEQFPVTAETRELLYGVSPTFAALRGEIEAGGSDRFATKRPDGVRDLGGQVFQWVVLDAIGVTGGATTARDLDDTFRSIGREIDAACDDDRLECGPPHSGIAPAWKWSNLPGLMSRTVTGFRKTIDLSAFTALSPDGDGTAADRALFHRMTNEPLAPGPNTFLVRQRVHLIGAFRWLYRLLTIVAVGIAMFRAYAALRDRRMPGWTMATLLSVGSLLVVVRVVGLAYLDLTAFPRVRADVPCIGVRSVAGARRDGCVAGRPGPVARPALSARNGADCLNAPDFASCLPGCGGHRRGRSVFEQRWSGLGADDRGDDDSSDHDCGRHHDRGNHHDDDVAAGRTAVGSIHARGGLG